MKIGICSPLSHFLGNLKIGNLHPIRQHCYVIGWGVGEEKWLCIYAASFFGFCEQANLLYIATIEFSLPWLGCYTLGSLQVSVTMMTSTRMRRRTENRRRIHSNGFFAELDTSVSLFVVWFANWTRCMRHWLYSLSRPQETFSALFQRTVAAVLQSVGSKLEIMAFIHALASLAVVWTMHVQFVANSSCEPVIASLLRNCSGVDGSKADIMQVQVVGELFKSTFHNENMSPSKCTFWRYEEMNVASASPEWHTFPLAKKGIVEEFLENILLRPTVLRYSSEKGLLLLNQNSWPNYNISFATLEIDLSNPCFGNWFLRKLVLETFVGYDTILLNAVAHYFQYRGYILHMLTGQVINLDVLFDVNISKLETCWYRKM